MTNSIDRRAFLIATSASLALASATRAGKATDQLRVASLKANYVDRPLGIEDPRPRLSWQIESQSRNVRQSAYRILVASAPEMLHRGRGNLWDSGKVKSRESFGIRYQGRLLSSRQRCWWHVQVWDDNGEPSEPSSPSWWEMGLLDPTDWKAQWLAVEDEVAREDRKAGLRWIWGDGADDKLSRKFRCVFELPAASLSGELVVVVNDWHWWMQITRIWIDGEPLAGPGAWVGMDAARASQTHLALSRQRLTLGSLRPGTHILAVEISTRDVWNVLGTAKMPKISYVPGFAASARFLLAPGDIVRIGSGQNWTTTLKADGPWYTPDYDDSAWSKAIAAPVGDYQPWPAQPAMHLRKRFALHMPVAKARLYATALGAYEARLNGLRVGDALLTPEPSQYAKRVLYQVYDVTTMLQTGENVLGLTVADGWYASFDGRFPWAPPPRRAIAQLELTFEDGSREIVATGPGWLLTESALRSSEIKIGEIYDARLEQRGWDKQGFDDRHWQPAHSEEAPSCRLSAQLTPPIRALQHFKPCSISQPKPGIYLVDFGQNFTGWCQLHITGSRGLQIEVAYAEVLTPTGEADSSNMHDPMGEPKRDIFILTGDQFGETLAPRFVYRGFRYVQVTGLQAPLTYECVRGVFIHTDLRLTGRFKSACSMLQTIFQNIVQTQRSNFTGIPTDNAVRELRGWMGDAAIFWDAAAFNMDVCAFTSRHMDNAADDQSEDGAFPNIAPLPRHGNAFHHAGTAPGWGDASIILPWTAWRRYGDTGIVERHWEGMNRYLLFIRERNPYFIWENDRSHDYGDSLATDPTTPKDLIATAYWAYSANLLAQMALAIGRNRDATRLLAEFQKIRNAFNHAFVKSDGTVGNGSQTSYILALRFELLTSAAKVLAAEKLAIDIRARGNVLTTGILGTQYVLDVLADSGHGQLAYDLLLRSEPPSWGHMIRNGATTIWETWNGSGARNQTPLGSIGGFMYRRIAGIDAAEPGFKKVVIRPLLDARVKHCGAEYDSVMGRISTKWELDSNGTLRLAVTIPPNVDAQINLPVGPMQHAEESGRDVSNHPDVRVRSYSEGEMSLDVGSGSYVFIVGSRAS